MAIKLLIGGSPCTKWSVAQKNGRETEPSGEGWEWFKNYLIAREKFKPDFFLYENNKSASQPIKDEIAKDLGVGVDPKARFTYINSGLVSAQNRQRFYVTNFGEIETPEDRGLLLKDVLQTGSDSTITPDYSQPVFIGEVPEHKGTYRNGKQASQQYRVYDTNAKGVAVTTCAITNVAEPVRVGCLPSSDGKVKDSQSKRIYDIEGKGVTLSAGGGGLGAKTGLYAVPVKVGEVNGGGQGNRVYSVDGKAVTQSATSGGLGSNTGLYAVPVETDLVPFVEAKLNDAVKKYGYIPEAWNPYNNAEIVDKAPTQTAQCASQTKSSTVLRFFNLGYATPVEWDEDGRPTKAVSCADGKTYTIYEVKGGIITIKGKEYSIKLADGFYTIRKLTVTECCRLQTMPDDYCKAVSDSQAYKGLGNGWTAEVIIHLLNHALKDVPRDEEIIVLSMYDGIGTGRYCLDKMGFTNIKYYAYEIDKYPIAIAMDNYPDIIQCGDAFAVREDGWELPCTR